MLQVRNIEKYYGSKNNVTKALDRVSFEVDDGEFIAIMGASGSGKTTVISLISRFWDASSGSVRVGGHEVRDIAPDALAEQVAVVFQDVYLLADTVANNIRVGKPDATQEEVEAAARATDTPVTRIGSIEAQHGLRVLGPDGRPLTQRWPGFDHFA